MKNEKIISLPNKIIVLTWDEDYDIDTDDILKIDVSNIFGEAVTFPVILNRLGIILAEIDDALRRQNFDLEKVDAELNKERAKAYDRAFEELKITNKSPTVVQCENRAKDDSKVLEREQERRLVKMKLLDVQKDRDIINSLYWSAKSKDDKLNKLTEKLKPIDFEDNLVEGKINNVMIKCTEKLIK